MHITRCWNPGLVFLTALLAGGVAIAGPAARLTQERPPLTEEERRRIMQRLIEQMQTAQEQQKLKEQQAQQAPPAPQPAPPPAPVPQPAPGDKPSVSTDQIQLNYENLDLYDFIHQIADTLAITPIIIDPEVKGNVTMHSSAPMSRADILPLFHLILKNNNAAMVKLGNLYQIVPISSGLKKGVEIIEHPTPEPPGQPKEEKPAEKPPEGGAPTGPQASPAPAAATPQNPPVAPGQAPAGAPAPQQRPPAPADTGPARLSTHVIRVEFVPVRDLVDAVKIFMTEGGVIMPYDRLNMLIITDYSDSVKRIIEIIRLLDNNYINPDLIELIRIKYNASMDVVEDLRKIFGSGAKDSATGVYFVSLDRQNAIMVMANSKRALEEVKRWIDKFDTTTGRSVQTFVYTVENSTATNIAIILSALFGGEGATGTTTGTTTSTTGTTTTGAIGGGRTGGLLGGSGTFGSGGAGTSLASTGFAGTGGTFGAGGALGGGGAFVGGGTQQLGPRLGTGVGASSQILRGGVLSGLQDTVRVVVDEINNALIIQASAADYAYILETIKKLDVLPRQALIDARIFEVELTDVLSYGVTSSLQARGTTQRLTTASTNATTGALLANTFAFIGGGREILLTLDALREKTKVKILESPSLLALDGTEAKIVVGGEVPYPVGTFVSSVGGSTTSTQYRETGVSLIVIPKISASGTVTLAIAQEVSTPGAPTTNGPTFNKTSISTTLAVKDGETVVIAGLIRDSDNYGRSGVPYLAQLPLIGSLFGKWKRTVNRTELIILITPHVIRTPERFQEMTQEVQDSLRDVRKLYNEKTKERIETMEDARKDRIKEEERRQKKSQPPDAKNPKD